MLHIHFSNRYEVLAAQLLGQWQAPAGLGALGGTSTGLDTLFAPRQVVVPSLAMRRALTLDIARTEGICAHVDFSFLAPWLWARLAGAGQRTQPLAAATLAWRVYQVFCDPAFVAGHPRLASYLHGADALMPFELARRSAELLEQYATYRTDGLAAWSEGLAASPKGNAASSNSQNWPGTEDHVDAAWQAALWRRLSDPNNGGITVDPAAHTLVQALPARAGEISQPAHIFALPTMPPLHLQWLQALARHAELHLYVLNPCREHWFDLVDERRLAQLAARGREQGFEVGNRLLATWGQQTQAHLDALVSAGGAQAVDDAVNLPAPGSSLLAQVQNAILDLREPEPAALLNQGADGSIELHVCHSLTRQLEALHGHLLQRFAQAQARAQAQAQAQSQVQSPVQAHGHGHGQSQTHAQSLPPGRVLVVLPDLEAAAPLIEAVFGTVPPERFIPYMLTGRPRSRNQAPARALLALLALAGSRWAASEVFALLQQPLVARRFGLLDGHDDQALQAVHAWMLASGVRWGRDGAHRAALGLPASAAHTWADAQARLFLAYAWPADAWQAKASPADALPANALPSRTSTPWCGLLPAGAVEGSSAQALGGMWAFLQALGHLQAQVAAPQLPAAWVRLLNQALIQFLQMAPGDETEDEGLRAVQEAIATLSGHWAAADLTQPLPLALVRAALERQLDDSAPGGVPGGAVTFAAMASLRGLPYDHVCVLGLEDGAWPGRSQPLEFDLMAAAPRRGDRQRRQEERNVFLDLLLAARVGFFLAYTGRSVRDNAVLSPSVLVSELMDSLGPVAALLRVEHPLQAFDPLVFRPDSDARLRSHDRSLARAVQASLRRGPSAAAHAPAGEIADHGVVADANASIDAGAGAGAGANTSTGANASASASANASASASASASPSANASTEASTDADDEVDSDSRAADPRPSFFRHPLPPLPAADADGVQRWPLARLLRFFRHPSRSLLQQRLGIRLPESTDALADDEAFVPGREARRALADQLLPALLQGLPLEDALALARAGTAWPSGELGLATLAAELPTLQGYAARVRAASAGPALPALAVEASFDIDGQPWRLSASYTDLRASGLLRWRLAPASGPDLLDAWLHHLTLCLGLQRAARSDVAPCTTWLAADRDWVLAPVADPAAELHKLLALAARGQRMPLHFYPRTAWARVSRPNSATAAASAWSSRPGGPWAEGDDAYFRLALRGVAEPLDAEFEALAQAVFGPLVQHLPDLNTGVEDDDDSA